MRSTIGIACKLLVWAGLTLAIARAQAAEDPEPHLTFLPWNDAGDDMLAPLPWTLTSDSDAMLSPVPSEAPLSAELTPVPWNVPAPELTPVPWDAPAPELTPVPWDATESAEPTP